MVWIEHTATDFRRRGGDLLDQVLAGAWIRLTRHGRPVAAFVPGSIAATLDPELSHTCQSCAAPWYGAATFCPACGVEQPATPPGPGAGVAQGGDHARR